MRAWSVRVLILGENVMEDAFKLLRQDQGDGVPNGQSKPETPLGETVQKPAQEPINAPPKRTRDLHLPKSQRALNRWLSERHELGRKGLVNVLNETLVSQFGPLKLKGNITLIHEDGNLEFANQLSLCRCGHSKNKPFCDEQHIEAEFKDSGRFAQGSEAAGADCGDLSRGWPPAVRRADAVRRFFGPAMHQAARQVMPVRAFGQQALLRRLTQTRSLQVVQS
jgi:CDGSH-type Zn-finger protein